MQGKFWNKHKAIFQAFGLHPTKFGEMLRGKDTFSYDYNYTSMLYNKIPVDIGEHQNLDTEKFSLKISEILTGLEFATQSEDNSIRYGSGNIGKMVNEMPFEEGYKTSDTICFTRTSDDSLGMLRTHDLLAFNKSAFSNKKFRNAKYTREYEIKDE